MRTDANGERTGEDHKRSHGVDVCCRTGRALEYAAYTTIFLDASSSRNGLGDSRSRQSLMLHEASATRLCSHVVQPGW